MGGECVTTALSWSFVAVVMHYLKHLDILDREVSGYSKVTMASIQAYDEQQGSSVGYSFGVREIWQCAAWCRRYEFYEM